MSFSGEFKGMLGGRKAAPVQPQVATYPAPDSLKIPTGEVEQYPDWDEVRQYQAEGYSVNEIPVCVTKPILATVMPAKRGVVRSFHVPAVAAGAVAIEIIPADPRIAQAYIVSDSNNPGAIYLGTQEQVQLVNVGDSDAYFYNGSTPLGPWRGFEQPIYALAQTGSSVNIVNVRIEYWAD